MKKKHPKKALLFIWTCNAVALSIFFFYWYREGLMLAELYSQTFMVWLLLLLAARHGGLFRFVDSKIKAGLGCIIEFAALVVLPFPLFALSIVLSCLLNMIDRLMKKHPEPFLGPDFNAASVVISGLLSYLTFHSIISSPADSDLFFTLALFAQALVFGTIQVLLINTLISLDENIPWKSGPAIKMATVLTEGILLITGAILAVTYLFNPYLILFFIVPALFLQNLLQNANKAHLIYIDEKTGIFNYRYFDEKINEHYILCQKQGRPLSLIFGDLDYLRDVNNNFGHSTGDEAIAAIGKIFKESQQEKFIAARFGGEEYVMILPNTSKRAAAYHAETIRKKVESLNLLSESGEKVPLSISLGVASFPTDATDIQTLIQVADEALYEAKRNGRNQVCLYEVNGKENAVKSAVTAQGGEYSVKVN